MGKIRKIVVEFNRSQDIDNLRTIMKNVHASNSDHLPDIAKFHLGDKIFIPNQVEKAELHIVTASGTEIRTFPKASLSFYLGTGHPFTKISMNSKDEGNYIVLPWNLGNRVGRDNLKNLNERLRASNIKGLKYIICVNSSDNLNSLSLENSKDLSQSLTSLASLHLSDIAAEDETEGLLDKIGDLEQQLVARDNVVNQKQNENTNLLRQVEQKQVQINSLTTQVNNFTNQIYYKQQEINGLNNQITNLNNKITQLSKNEVSWDSRVKNQTLFEFVGFTGQLKTVIDPVNGTMTFNVI